jgi:hypothetical protein
VKATYKGILKQADWEIEGCQDFLVGAQLFTGMGRRVIKKLNALAGTKVVFVQEPDEQDVDAIWICRMRNVKESYEVSR